MFCPSCTDEFRDGIVHCPDCDVALVAERVSLPRPPAEPDLDPHEPVELFWTSDPQFLVDAASLLSSESIPFSTEGAESLKPAASKENSSPEPIAARLMVPAKSSEEARALLDRADLDPGALRVRGQARPVRIQQAQSMRPFRSAARAAVSQS